MFWLRRAGGTLCTAAGSEHAGSISPTAPQTTPLSALAATERSSSASLRSRWWFFPRSSSSRRRSRTAPPPCSPRLGGASRRHPCKRWLRASLRRRLVLTRLSAAGGALRRPSARPQEAELPATPLSAAARGATAPALRLRTPRRLLLATRRASPRCQAGTPGAARFKQRMASTRCARAAASTAFAAAPPAAAQPRSQLRRTKGPFSPVMAPRARGRCCGLSLTFGTREWESQRPPSRPCSSLSHRCAGSHRAEAIFFACFPLVFFSPSERALTDRFVCFAAACRSRPGPARGTRAQASVRAPPASRAPTSVSLARYCPSAWRECNGHTVGHSPFFSRTDEQ